MKICPVGAELFHADRRTDMTKLIAAFHDLAKAPKNDCMKCGHRRYPCSSTVCVASFVQPFHSHSHLLSEGWPRCLDTRQCQQDAVFPGGHPFNY